MRYVSKTIFVIVVALLMGVVPATAQKKQRKAKTEQTQQADKKAEVNEENKAAEEQEKKAEEKKVEEEKPKKEFHFDEKAPILNPNATPRLYHIREVNVHGVEHMNENLVRSTSGLIPGDTIYLPSSYISNSITRLWGGRYFSDIKVGATIRATALTSSSSSRSVPVYITGRLPVKV